MSSESFRKESDKREFPLTYADVVEGRSKSSPRREYEEYQLQQDFDEAMHGPYRSLCKRKKPRV